jgi:hypothetical protein
MKFPVDIHTHRLPPVPGTAIANRYPDTFVPEEGASDAYVYRQEISWNRIISGTTTGMATQYTFYRQIKAFEGAMFLNSLNCILRTGRSKSARRGSHGRNTLPVKINRKQQQI